MKAEYRNCSKYASILTSCEVQMTQFFEGKHNQIKCDTEASSLKIGYKCFTLEHTT